MKSIEEKHILFEDNHLLIVNKPANLLTQPTNQEAVSLEYYAKAYVKAKYNKPGNVFLHAAHRLDKAVSGIVVFAKTSKALSRVNQQIREGRWKKTYLANLDTPIEPRQAELEDYLVHANYHAKVVDANTSGAKKAILSYKTLDSGQVQIELVTGRYHQIRAQFASRGHPIRGDRKYGSVVRCDHGIELRHESLELPHPIQSSLKDQALHIKLNPMPEIQ